MAGGIAPKSFALVEAARSATDLALARIQKHSESGNQALDTRAAVTDTAIAAAIVALQALV